MTDLKQQLIRLGDRKPDLRKHLRPVLNTITKTGSRGLDGLVDATIEHVEQRGYTDTYERWELVSNFVYRNSKPALSKNKSVKLDKIPSQHLKSSADAATERAKQHLKQGNGPDALLSILEEAVIEWIHTDYEKLK